LESQLEIRRGRPPPTKEQSKPIKTDEPAFPPANGFPELDHDWVVSVLRANESKLKPDDRVMVKLKLQETRQEKQKAGRISFKRRNWLPFCYRA
jgi:hypothetical protein